MSEIDTQRCLQNRKKMTHISKDQPQEMKLHLLCICQTHLHLFKWPGNTRLRVTAHPESRRRPKFCRDTAYK